MQKFSCDKIFNGFSLTDNTEELVILKNEVKTPLEVAQHPYLSSDVEYVTITKGPYDHTVTIIKKDGTTFSFDIGRRSTLVSENLTRLKNKAIEAAHYFGVLLEIKTMKKPDSVRIFYNDNYRAWQAVLTVRGLKGSEYIWTDASNQNEILKHVEGYFDVDFGELYEGIAQTGIKVWDAMRQA